MEKIRICCNVSCPDRLECQMFRRAMDVNAGTIRSYEIIECINHNYYEK